MKVDQCQPHENSWTACQSSQVVNWVKTKPGLAGNQIPFGGTRFGFTSIGVYNRGIIDTYTKGQLISKCFFVSSLSPKKRTDKFAFSIRTAFRDAKRR